MNLASCHHDTVSSLRKDSQCLLCGCDPTLANANSTIDDFAFLSCEKKAIETHKFALLPHEISSFDF